MQEIAEEYWLSKSALELLRIEDGNNWSQLEHQSTLETYSAIQNHAMFGKFFLEQFNGDGRISGKTLGIIERDFDGISRFQELWTKNCADGGFDWIILGLSFADFRFHLFPIGNSGSHVPFCVSPIMCTCSRPDIISLSGLTPRAFAEVQWRHIDWIVVEHRLACLEQPLDVFGENSDCQADACGNIT